MDSFKTIDKIIDFHINNKLPETIFIYMTEEEIKQKLKWLFDYANVGDKLNEFGTQVDRIDYRGFVLYIINTDIL